MHMVIAIAIGLVVFLTVMKVGAGWINQAAR